MKNPWACSAVAAQFNVWGCRSIPSWQCDFFFVIVFILFILFSLNHLKVVSDNNLIWSNSWRLSLWNITVHLEKFHRFLSRAVTSSTDQWSHTVHDDRREIKLSPLFHQPLVSTHLFSLYSFQLFIVPWLLSSCKVDECAAKEVCSHQNPEFSVALETLV